MATSQPTHAGEPSSVELWVRSLARPAVCREQSDLVSRLDRLEKRGVIGGVDVGVWGREMVLSASTVRTAPGRRFTNRYELFRRWADRNGASLAPFFEQSQVTSDITGEEFTVVLFPVTTLAEFDGGDLVHVSPCSVDGTVRTVHDRLAAMEADAGGEQEPPADRGSEPPDALVGGTTPDGFANEDDTIG